MTDGHASNAGIFAQTCVLLSRLDNLVLGKQVRVMRHDLQDVCSLKDELVGGTRHTVARLQALSRQEHDDAELRSLLARV